jgi:hypothetical protein
MKAFNVDQPWAELIIQGRKKIELRGKRTSHRGVIAVRSTKKVLQRECNRLRVDCDKVSKAAILGTVEIVKVIDFTQKLWEDLRDEHLSDDPHPGNRKGWKLKKPRRLQSPIPYPRPLPGVFVLSEETAEKIQEAQK